MKLKKISTTCLLFGSLAVVSFAQTETETIVLVEEELTPLQQIEQRIEIIETTTGTQSKLKVSGYIQTQYQYGETDADGVKVGSGIEKQKQADLKGFSRFGVRRGRIKFTYTDGLVEGVFQPDFTEKGIAFKDVYLSVKDPIWGTNSLKAGIFDRPFGHEISYSSSRRESPERSRIFQSLFPDERDLGAMLTLQADKNSPWNILKLEAGLFAGNGIRPEIDSKLDFIGHLSAKKTIGDMEIGGGVSAYLGGSYQGTNNIYVMKNDAWVLDSSNPDNIGSYAKRQYIGFDLQFSAMTVAGLTQLRGEYIVGEHAGTVDKAYDFKPTSLPTTDTYMRKLSGGYVLLAQDLGATPFTIVAKYDCYDPNTQISGNDIAGAGEITKSTIGLGAIWRINNALKLTAYYDIVKNETTDKLPDTKDIDGKITKYGYEGDRKDNVFTLRLQYKF
ncbi:MAG: hypothetical protein LBR81_08915 [Prevotellaceae bacterium]|jgi:phosphate-selective porin|nr:hypothetical protein [Prevotellaceae bacterium]